MNIAEMDITGRMIAAAKRLSPFATGSLSIKVEEAVAVATEYVATQQFLPMGDNHHNAARCPYCRDGHVVVFLKPDVAKRFVNPAAEWKLDDERALAQAVKDAVG